MEQAVHLLRTGSASALAFHYIGSIPFVLAFLFFWTEMSRSAFAEARLSGSALTVTFLFLWLKTWQTAFCAHLRAQLLHRPPDPLRCSRLARSFACQSALQPSGLFLLPVATLLTIPFGWVFAFYQNVTALDDGETDLKTVFKQSAQQAALWPHQNHGLIFLVTGFSFLVFLNWTSVCLMLPHLLKTLFGAESSFSRSASGLFNSTFLISMVALTWLSVDPIIKAIYTLRCFYGQALRSGEDLKAELRHLARHDPSAATQTHGWEPPGPTEDHPFRAHVPRSSTLPLALILFLLSLPGPSLTAAPGTPTSSTASSTPSETTVPPSELKDRIQEVLQKPKYSWRMPREKALVQSKEKGVIGRFLERMGETLKSGAKTVVEWLDRLLRKLFRNTPTAGPSSGYGWATTLKLLLAVLVAAVIGGILLLLFRIWNDRVRNQLPLASQPVDAPPDLNDENVSADQLPEDGWLSLARELMAQGDLRLAMRAMYLASLSHLAQRNLLTLARSKSNLEYQRELARRAHAFPGLQDLFAQNLTVFERIWYGMHQISRDLVDHFAENVRRIKEGSA